MATMRLAQGKTLQKMIPSFSTVSSSFCIQAVCLKGNLYGLCEIDRQSPIFFDNSLLQGWYVQSLLNWMRTFEDT